MQRCNLAPFLAAGRSSRATITAGASPGPPSSLAAVAREGIDGVSRWFGIRWDDPSTARLSVRDELINAGGLVSGVATYALVDYTMGSVLWPQTAEDEGIPTINIAINYAQ